MSQNEVNDIKSHVNQLVLGSAQTYINILRSEIYQSITQVITQGEVNRQLLQTILDTTDGVSESFIIY